MQNVTFTSAGQGYIQIDLAGVGRVGLLRRTFDTDSGDPQYRALIDGAPEVFSSKENAAAAVIRDRGLYITVGGNL